MLSEQQLGFFARNGFLHVQNCVPADACAALVEKSWAKLPDEWKRQDQSTWNGMVTDSCHSAEIAVRHGHLKFQKGDLINNPVLTDGLANNSGLGRVAQEMIGAPLAQMRVRGLYCIVPLRRDDVPAAPLPPHIEAHPTQLVCLCYLADVPPDGGGLLVWPGSHREIYPTMSSRLEFSATEIHSQVFAKWSSKKPREIFGKRGDVVIIHHRLLHAPSINRAENIRFGFLCDYHRADFRQLSMLPPGGDLWEDWPAIRRLDEELRDGDPDFILEPATDIIAAPSFYSWRRKPKFWSRKTSPMFPPGTSADYVRKNDASVLARSRHDGDIWLHLSDEPSTADQGQLQPQGSTWHNSDLRVTLDGKPVDSLCYYDLISRVSPGPGHHLLAISGLDRDAWIRILKMKLPLHEPDVLLKAKLNPGRTELNFLVPA
jgi:ectoine hydroxylase-related dioxygenase (phytanoyl-CoA dioxygenase family)